MAFSFKINAHNIFYIIVFTFAVALQVQVTLFVSPDFKGLRVGLGDIFLPFFGLAVVYTLIRGRTLWPRFYNSYMIFWLMALIGVMTIALFNGPFSMWALVNKYIGLWLLVSYFLFGAWIAQNVTDRARLFKIFMHSFAGFFVVTLTAMLIVFVLQYFIPLPLWLSDYPWDGFMMNRNVFAVLFVLAALFIIWSYKEQEPFISKHIRFLFWLLLPLFFVFNESRTGWIAAVFLALIFLLKKPLGRLKVALPLLLAGIVLAYSSYFFVTHQNAFALKGMQFKYLMALAQDDDLNYMGDRKRYIAVEDGLELYGQHNPVFGAGLGSYKPFQIEKRGEYIDVIDFTALWLLVETGALGLAVFGAFFVVCGYSLYQQAFVTNQSSFHRAMFVFLIMFAGMSVLHELMYTRFLWFAMGLAMVRLNQGDQDQQTHERV